MLHFVRIILGNDSKWYELLITASEIKHTNSYELSYIYVCAYINIKYESMGIYVYIR